MARERKRHTCTITEYKVTSPYAETATGDSTALLAESLAKLAESLTNKETDTTTE